MSDPVKVSETTQWDSKVGAVVSTIVLEAFDAQPVAPEDAIDTTETYADGKYITTYRTMDGSDAYKYCIQSTLSTEPLKTHPKFGSGGEYELSADDLKQIKDAEADPSMWATLADTEIPGLWEYVHLVMKGVDSYLCPAVTLHITEDVDELTDLAGFGKIAEPAGAPSLPEGCTWLFSGFTADALANGKWRIQSEYRASGSSGWDDVLYS